MSEGRLRPFGPIRWEALAGVAALDQWLWFDTAGDGIHQQGELGPAPAEATHVWGWSNDGQTCLRARADRSLLPEGIGLVGAVLGLNADQPGDVVEVTERPAQIWSPQDGRINAEPTNRVFGGSRLLRRLTVFTHNHLPDGQLLEAPLEFLVLEGTGPKNG